MEPRVKSTHPLHTSFDLVPLALKKTADLVDLLQAKALSQPEALARGRPSLAYRLVALIEFGSKSSGIPPGPRAGGGLD